MGTVRSRCTQRAGYTLIELMIVVLIIAFSAVAFAPGIGRATADRRVSTMARELIRVGRRARADTFGYLRAHLLWIEPATGTVQLLRGATNSCTLATAAWSTIQGDCVAKPAKQGARCLENLNIATETTDSTIYLYEEQLAGTTASYVQTARAICYAPSGLVYTQTGANLAAAVASGLLPDNTVSGGFVYSLHKGGATAASPTTASRVHRVLYPLGGSARSLR